MEAVLFQGATDKLVGVWHPPLGTAPPGDACGLTIVMLHGWSGTRSGPHQMLTRAAREFAASGFGVLRFDFGGRGDSAGDSETATLATMREDARAALKFCNEKFGARKFVLLGLCSGCEVAFSAAMENGIAALCLWSAPVFAAGHSDERAARKRNDNLKKYARKLLDPATYAKALTGKLDTAAIRKAASGQGGESKNVESEEAGQLPPGWKNDALARFQKFSAPLLLIYGSADPTTGEALVWHRHHCNPEPQVKMISGANHSYYGLAWEREVIETTRRWLCEIAPDVE